ncbi:small membrane protein YmiC [Pseudocitrobacter cyperus]|uniref:Small membrane protein YmiC n=1 Tax=Pseudocitrobacter cyperus TaxID=3112843 RepID=A0ABV0HEF3_9ENTR
MNTTRNIKYWSWMGVLSVSLLFWGQIIWLLCR